MPGPTPADNAEIGPKGPLAQSPAGQPSGPVVGALPQGPAASAVKGNKTVIDQAFAVGSGVAVSKPATEKGKTETGGATKVGGSASGGYPTSSTGGAAKVGGKEPTAAAKAAAVAAATPAPNVPKTSAAAVVQAGVKNISAKERTGATGLPVSTGKGSEPAPAAPKSKAKAKPAAKAGAAPTPVAVSTGPAPKAPAAVLKMVSATPTPAAEAESSTKVSAPYTAGGVSVGPSRAFAKAGAGDMAAARAIDPTLAKEGPAAMAVGRSVMAGGKGVTTVGGKAHTSITKKFQIAFCTSEVAPFSKTGGLGEAMDGLPTALAALGHRVMVISPRYDQYADSWDTSFWSEVTMAGKKMSVHFFHCFKQKVDYVFCDHPTFCERVDGTSGSKLYGPEWGKDFADNQARFAYFCKACLVAIKDLPLGGFAYGDKTMVVANDWHSALVPMFMHAERAADPSQWKDTKTAFLCHNAVFQGRFELEEGLADTFGVPEHYIKSITFKQPLKVGKYNKKGQTVNTMAAGLRYADRALTVSPSYAKECAADPEKGVELEELFALGRVTGIVNGVKEGVSPAEKNFVTKTKMSCGTFTPATALAAKAQLKAAYLAEVGWSASKGPMMCFIGRLDSQKGYDLLLEACVEVLEDTEMQVIIVGAGRADLVAQTKAVEKKFPDKFYYAGWMGPERYALLAGCDWTLLPSRWEPCGLVQMEAMRMGTLPIVAATGGLKDTVQDGVNGIWLDSEMTVEAELDEESVQSIVKGLKRAAEIHMEPQKEGEMKIAAMAAAAEFTWSNAALQYEVVFEELGVVDILPMCDTKTVSLEVDNQIM